MVAHFFQLQANCSQEEARSLQNIALNEILPAVILSRYQKRLQTISYYQLRTNRFIYFWVYFLFFLFLLLHFQWKEPNCLLITPNYQKKVLHDCSIIAVFVLLIMTWFLLIYVIREWLAIARFFGRSVVVIVVGLSFSFSIIFSKLILRIFYLIPTHDIQFFY